MDGEILAPQKVEYVVVKPKVPRSLRLTLISLIILLIALFGSIAWYFLHDRTHRFKARDLPTLGLKAALKAKWVDGAAHYVFATKPMTGQEDGFANAFRTNQVPYHFEIQLLDQDGFRLCSSSPNLVQVHGAEGRITSLKAEQNFSNCTENELALATGWDVTYEGPTAASNAQGTHEAPAPPPTPATNKTSGSTQTLAASKLTGSDFESGEVETLNGSFKVSRRAEFMTLGTWRAGADLKIDCQGAACVITNLTDDQSVHARKR